MNLPSNGRRHAFPDFTRRSDAAPPGGGFRRYTCLGGEIVLTDGDASPQGRLDRLEKEAAQREEDAYRRGLAEGEAAGREAGAAALTPVLERFRQSISQVERFRKQIYHNVEQEAVALALALARKIVGYEVRINSEVVLHTVRQALQKVVDHERIRIKLNPADLQTVQNHLPEFSPVAEHVEQIVFEGDEAITAGGCLVETNFGDIDAKIESQLDAVRQTLRLGLDQSPHRLAESAPDHGAKA